MIIGSHQQLHPVYSQPSIFLGGDEIQRVKSTKSFGVMIDETLSWGDFNITIFNLAR
jgi:hypothetical protein